jgi:hypothetical protein
MKVAFQRRSIFTLYSVFFILFLVVSCNTKSVERIPAEQIAAEPTEPLPEPAPQASVAPAGLTINPAHGQPGHRCDIQVGAPLNGTATTTAPSVFEAADKGAVVNSTANLNPAHGQPGHRCDIPVGSPL